MTPSDDLLRTILADLARTIPQPLRDDGSPRPFGPAEHAEWTAKLRQVAGYVDAAAQYAAEHDRDLGLAEIRASAVRCAALALGVAAMADEARKTRENLANTS